tara:strand:+ start:74 stop:343 length:270 start_codon:yes stop_codon:yes gene_type:complete
LGKNGINGKPNNTLKEVGKLFGKFGWNKKLSELNEQEILFLILVLQGMERVEDEFEQTYLAAIWLKYTIGEENTDFPFGENVRDDKGKS